MDFGKIFWTWSLSYGILILKLIGIWLTPYYMTPYMMVHIWLSILFRSMLLFRFLPIGIFDRDAFIYNWNIYQWNNQFLDVSNCPKSYSWSWSTRNKHRHASHCQIKKCFTRCLWPKNKHKCTIKFLHISQIKMEGTVSGFQRCMNQDNPNLLTCLWPLWVDNKLITRSSPTSMFVGSY